MEGSPEHGKEEEKEFKVQENQENHINRNDDEDEFEEDDELLGLEYLGGPQTEDPAFERFERHYSLVFVIRENEDGGRSLLLGFKKRGFGAGKFNGFGGKQESGENMEECARRELREESGLEGFDFAQLGYLVFNFQDNPETMKVHVFVVGRVEGEIVESDEMRPEWFEEESLPFDQMWVDDQHWLPLLLQHKTFLGNFEMVDEEEIDDFSLVET